MKKICPIMSQPIFIRSNRASESGKEFFAVSCYKEKCQLWIPDYEDGGNCAYVVDATKYSKDLLRKEFRRRLTQNEKGEVKT